MTNKAIVSRIRAVPKYFWVLLAIMIVGVFCRTYQFHDWLRFSPDEARDATYISDAITGKAPLPALGPQAGNTQFYLGPLYYQAEYVSALVFGNAPDKIAYFDLIFSILSIPMLFLRVLRAATIVVAVPQNGSSTVSPTKENIWTRREASSRGKGAGCSLVEAPVRFQNCWNQRSNLSFGTMLSWRCSWVGLR